MEKLSIITFDIVVHWAMIAFEVLKLDANYKFVLACSISL